VAGITVEAFVSAVQLEPSAPVMIEVPNLPVSGVVAVLALRAEPSSMHILVLVTGVTGYGCLVFVELARVATLTESDPVLAQ
jgi:hypothetical protein